ncbi:MAG: magnesium transporter CorA family protein [Patescibacteria group bacterium]
MTVRLKSESRITNIEIWYNISMPFKNNSHIKSVKIGEVTWTHVSNITKKEIDALKRHFGFGSIDLKEALPPLQRPKLVARDGYLFMILLYPVFDRKDKTIRSSEVDFFIDADNLVTINSDGLAPLITLFEKCHKVDTKQRDSVCNAGDVAHLLYNILDQQLEVIFPMVIHLANDIDEIEGRLFQEFEKNLIQELLRVKTNIVNVRKAIQGHKTVIRQLIKESEGRFPIDKLEAYFERLVEHTKELWDTLENQKDTINALHETNVSLIDFRINEIMKRLQVFAVIVFPLTLLAAIFGMNTRYTPFVDHPNGFWMIAGLMLTGTAVMLIYFKHKKWL